MDGSRLLAAYLGGYHFMHGGQQIGGIYNVKAGDYPPPFPSGMRVFTIGQDTIGVIDHTVAKHLLVGGAIAAE